MLLFAIYSMLRLLNEFIGCLVHLLGPAMQGFELPAEDAPVKQYLEALQSRQSWKNTQYSEDLVNAGWKSHLEG